MSHQNAGLDRLRVRVASRIASGAAILALLLVSTSAEAVSVRYTYDALGRVAQAIFDNGSGTTTTISYSYDAAGNRSSVSTTSP